MQESRFLHDPLQCEVFEMWERSRLIVGAKLHATQVARFTHLSGLGATPNLKVIQLVFVGGEKYRSSSNHGGSRFVVLVCSQAHHGLSVTVIPSCTI